MQGCNFYIHASAHLNQKALPRWGRVTKANLTGLGRTPLKGSLTLRSMKGAGGGPPCLQAGLPHNAEKHRSFNTHWDAFPAQPVKSSELYKETRLASSLHAYLVAGGNILLSDTFSVTIVCVQIHRRMSLRDGEKQRQDRRSEGFSKGTVSGRRQLLPEALPYKGFILNSSWGLIQAFSSLWWGLYVF